MYKDEIVEEIHKYREEYAKSFNYDLKAIFDDLRKKQIARGRKVIKLPIKRQCDLLRSAFGNADRSRLD
jgi:hypothetical protein